jgi:hypothetical protein
MIEINVARPPPPSRWVRTRAWFWRFFRRDGVQILGIIIGAFGLVAAVMAALWLLWFRPESEMAATECRNKCVAQQMDFYSVNETDSTWFCYCTDGKRVEQVP